MKLFCSLTSPYARKIRVALRETGLTSSVEEVVVDPWASPAEFLLDNPLSKVPALRIEGGETLPDSALILEYLCSLDTRLAPAGPERWKLARQIQLADGIIDAAVNTIIEKRRPPALISTDWLARQQSAIFRVLDALENEHIEAPSEIANLLEITLACALAYLDFRNITPGWRSTRPLLAQWYEKASQRPSMIETQPPA